MQSRLPVYRATDVCESRADVRDAPGQRNAQFERAFYGRQMPAWGVYDHTVVFLMASLAEDAWARSVH